MSSRYRLRSICSPRRAHCSLPQERRLRIRVRHSPAAIRWEASARRCTALDVTDLSRGRVADGFTFAAGGDLLGPYNPLTQLGDPDVNKMLKLLQDADVGFANHEASSFDLPGPPGTTQAAQNGGGYPRFSTALDRDFRAMGIKLVSMANNHAGDWGMEGLIATLATVQASGLVQAGAGASMNDARRAGVVYTPRGNVGLISTASTFNPATMAADGDGAIKPRPGVSVLRVRPVVALNEEQMVLMRRLERAPGGVPTMACVTSPAQSRSVARPSSLARIRGSRISSTRKIAMR